MSDQRYDDEFLKRLRNDIPITKVIQHLDWPCKVRDGRFVFLCPRCQETESAVNSRTNLGRCFHCETNFNPIDFTICAWRCDFRTAVKHLTPLLPR
jgi:DNA primase